MIKEYEKLKGLPLNIIEKRLREQNYNLDLIFDLLYKHLDEKVPENFLEIGDYFPFIKIGSKEIYNIVNDKDIFIIIIDKIEKPVLDIILNFRNYNLFLLYGEIENNLNIPDYFINKNKFPNILQKDKNLLYILDANRRIKQSFRLL